MEMVATEVLERLPPAPMAAIICFPNPPRGPGSVGSWTFIPERKDQKSWGTTVQYRLQKTAPATSCCHWTNDSLCFTGKEDKKSTCLSHIPLRHVWKPLTIKYGHAYWSLIGSPKICGPQIPFPMLKEWIEMTKPTICCIRLETSISSICKCLGSLCLQNWFVIRL